MREYGKLRIETPEKLYFTADPHFFHAGVIGFCKRPFRDAGEMNEALIRNWNAMVPKDGGSQVIVLGDMFFKAADTEKCAKIMERLNGTKYLVAGNHDKLAKEEVLALGFADAWDYLELTVAREKKKLIVCSHYPLLEWNGFYRGSWHLHGHVHGRGSHFSARVLDVGVDAHNYAPISFLQIERELNDGWDLDQLLMKERGTTERHRPYVYI